MITAKWTGSFPNLCRGDWIIENNGKLIIFKNSCPMNTYGEYENKWCAFNEKTGHWEDYCEKYTDGLKCDEWIVENDYWLNKICESYAEKVEAFLAISKQDWRMHSCGGCL